MGEQADYTCDTYNVDAISGFVWNLPLTTPLYGGNAKWPRFSPIHGMCVNYLMLITTLQDSIKARLIKAFQGNSSSRQFRDLE